MSFQEDFDAMKASLQDLRRQRRRAVVLVSPEFFKALPDKATVQHVKVSINEAWFYGFPVVAVTGQDVVWKIGTEPKRVWKAPAPVAQRS